MPYNFPSKTISVLVQELRSRQEAWRVCFQDIQKMPLWTIPHRVSCIFASGETSSVEECQAAERCCCHQCADCSITIGKVNNSLLCTCCGRGGCASCIAVRPDGRNQCNSRVCALVSRLHAGTCSFDEFCIESDKLSRMLMQQWLVLQFKHERQLGCLRAYFLVQSRYSALLCAQALSLRNAVQEECMQGSVQNIAE